MTSIKSVTSLILDQPPSCIAFCPTLPKYFVVGTYLLHTGKDNDRSALSASSDAAQDEQDSTQTAAVQKRSGSLILYCLRGDTMCPTPDSAILDIQWSPHHAQHGALLAVATSTGLLSFYELDAQSRRLNHVATERLCEPSILVLSLCWHPLRPDTIGLTLSNGDVRLCRNLPGKQQLWRGGGGLSQTTVYQHTLEPWMMAFAVPLAQQESRHEHVDVLSGGDDQIFHRSHMSDGNDNEDDWTVLWEDRRIHQAGVTAILPLPTTDLIVTGSYDDHIRLLSAPAAGRRQVLAEQNLRGGVWRLKTLEDSSAPAAARAAASDMNGSLLILASCMHAGARVLRLSQGQDGEEWGFEVLAKFEKHKSMNYGSDVQPSGGGEGAVKAIVSTSFYDKLLCLWRFDVGG